MSVNNTLAAKVLSLYCTYIATLTRNISPYSKIQVLLAENNLLPAIRDSYVPPLKLSHSDYIIASHQGILSALNAQKY